MHWNMLLAFIITVALWAWTVAHQALLLWIYSAMIERLPLPDSSSGKVYTYIFSVLQFFAANTLRSQDAVRTRPIFSGQSSAAPPAPKP